MKTIIGLIIVLSVLIDGMIAVSGTNELNKKKKSEKDYIQYWISNYGDYSETEAGHNDPRIPWVKAVFKRVCTVADIVDLFNPRLLIVNDILEDDAIVLPDGGIIVHTRVLDYCYGSFPNIRKHNGDNRIAFVLGHELAHMGNRDFLYGEAFAPVKKWGTREAQKKLARFLGESTPQTLSRLRDREFLADKNGALYATMAGFDMGGLFHPKNNFLSQWAVRSGTGMFYDDDPRHPSLHKRLLFLRPQLLEVAEKLELFRAGVLLFHLESYTDAGAAFIQFSNVFHAREVYNNIGACYFNFAMRIIHLRYHHDYYRFRFSTCIDYDTTAETMTPREPGGYLSDAAVARSIDKAVLYYKMSVKKDPEHPSSRLNLAAVYILAMKHADAQAVLKPLLEKFPHHPGALNNKAVALYYYGREENIDTTQAAIRLLEHASKKNPLNYEILYNLGTLKKIRGRIAGAKFSWKEYLELSTTPRDRYYQYLYEKIHGKPYKIRRSRLQPPAIPFNIQIGDSPDAVRKKMETPKNHSYQLGTEFIAGNENVGKKKVIGEIFLPLEMICNKSIRVLALDKRVEVVEWALPNPAHTTVLLDRYGPPGKIIHHNSGCFYIYPSHGFSLKEVEGKIWSYIRYSRGF